MLLFWQVADLKKKLDAQNREEMKALAKKHKDKAELNRIKREAQTKHIQMAVQERQKVLIRQFLLCGYHWWSRPGLLSFTWHPHPQHGCREQVLKYAIGYLWPLESRLQEISNGIWHAYIEQHRGVIYRWKPLDLYFSTKIWQFAYLLCTFSGRACLLSLKNGPISNWKPPLESS